jgi:hypothetical protein
MAGIKIDPDWVSGYAKRVARAADELDKGADLMGSAPLRHDSFGDLGRTVRSADAYARAAEMLRGQLSRAVEALTSAADGLRDVADRYRAADDDSAHLIKRSEHG